MTSQKTKSRLRLEMISRLVSRENSMATPTRARASMRIPKDGVQAERQMNQAKPSHAASVAKWSDS
jgi:hypothetical protein